MILLALPLHAATWLDHLVVEKGLAEHSLSAYRRDLELYASYLDDVGIDDPSAATPAEVEAFAAWLRHQRTARGTPYAASSIARTTVAVRGFHRFLAREGIAHADTAADLVSPKTQRPLPKPLSLEQIGALLDAPGEADAAALRDTALLELLYSSGLRASEIVGLDVDDVDPVSSTVRCIGKGSKERVVPVGRPALAAVDAWLVRGRPQLEPPGPWLFANARGQRLTRQGVWKIVKRHAEAAGLPDHTSPHSMRHSFATHLVDNGADVRIVQELLGHASVNTTQIYTEVSRAHLADLYDRAHPRARDGEGLQSKRR